MGPRVTVWLLLIHGIAAGLTVAAASTDERLLVGAVVGLREVGSLEVISRDESFLVPLARFAEISGCTVEGQGDAASLRTPLGTVSLDELDPTWVDGTVYLPEPAIERRLAAELIFDPGEYAVRFDFPWSGTETQSATASYDRIPDVRAPGLTLSMLREDLLFSRQGSSDVWASTTTLGGALEGGFWRMRFEDDLEGDRMLRDYAWSRTAGRKLFLVGQQSLQLHPLVNGFQLTGVQAAWTNQPLDRFSRHAAARELLPRQVRPSQHFDGQAPPGALVELRVDGVLRERRIVGMDGFFDFSDVRLPSRQLNRVEVLIFDRQHPQTPIEVREHRVSNSDYLLPARAVVHLGGLGRYGNLAEDLGEESVPDEAAGFYQWRYGLTEGFTAETTIQHAAGRFQAQAGFTSRLADSWIFSMGVAGSNGSLGYNLDLDGQGDRWSLLASSRATPADFHVDGGDEQSDHAAEGWYRLHRTFELGLAGRFRRTSTGRTDYLLPAMTWRPGDRWLFRARPDHGGDYRFHLAHWASARDRWIVTSEGRTVVDYSHTFDSLYRVSAGTEFGEGRPERHSVVVSRQGRDPRAPRFSLGAAGQEGEIGWLAGTTFAVLPGVLARLDYESSAANPFGTERRDDRLSFGITVDLTLAGRRVLPADSVGNRPDSGAIAGGIRISERGAWQLQGSKILVDGRLAARTDAAGNYYIGNLDPGIYQVELDPERLPLELVPRDTVTIAEVSSGASTRVDFLVRPEFGLAGRVTGPAGRVRPDVSVKLFDTAGTAVGSSRTDRFGLFRMDGIPAGSYVLRAVDPGSGGSSAPRRIRVVDAFLFDQDLELLPEAAAPDSHTGSSPSLRSSILTEPR